MAQTTTNETELIIGSAKVLFGTTAGDLVDVGGCDEVGFTMSGENQEILFDNADAIQKVFRDGALVKFTWGQFVTERAKKLFGHSGDVYDTTAAAPVDVTDSYAINTLTLGLPVALSVEANGDGTVIAVTSITQDAGGTPVVLTEDDDYFVSFIGGKTYVTFIAGTLTDLTDTQAILFTHTPAASFNWKGSTGSYVPDYYYVRLIHTTAAGKTFQVDIPKAQTTTLGDFAFPADGGADVMKVPTEMKGVNDASGYCFYVTNQIA